MDDFDQLWNEEMIDNNNNNNIPVEVQETKEYQIRDAYARYKIMSDIVQLYFSEKHGEKIITEKKVNPNPINFHLN